MVVLTDKQAYTAMFRFLEGLYERTKSADLGGFLGGMSLLADGSTADPAVAEDWRQAVEYAVQGGEPPLLTLTPKA
jgi:hypothetical protein